MNKKQCRQYNCINNTGLPEGKISFENEGFCKLEGPLKISDENNVVICKDEIYYNKTKYKFSSDPKAIANANSHDDLVTIANMRMGMCGHGKISKLRMLNYLIQELKEGGSDE